MSAITAKYEALGGAGFLGEENAPEQPCPDGVGKHQHFEGGSIYWSPDTGAHVISGLIRDKWKALGWERGPLGYPISDEAACAGGRYSQFQHGTILWRKGTKEAFEVRGAIRNKWAQLGRETGLLGYPETDELTCPDKAGRFAHFQHGSVYWTSGGGAHEVHGVIRQKWAELGWETSHLGYPISDERATADGLGRYNEFRRGRISWSEDTGVKVERKEKEVPPFPRLITALGSVHIVDHESGGADEQETVPINIRDRVVRNRVPQELVRFKAGVGGEVRYELDLDVYVDDFIAILEGEQRLYEGSSESTTDLLARSKVLMLAQLDDPPIERLPGGLGDGQDFALLRLVLTHVVE